MREDCLNGHTFAQAFPYPFHLHSAGGRIRSYFESGFGSFDEIGRNRVPVRYGEGVRSSGRWGGGSDRRAYWG